MRTRISRFETIFVVAIVAALSISAVLTEDRTRTSPLTLCIPGAAPPTTVVENLTASLSASTQRTVVLKECGTGAGHDHAEDDWALILVSTLDAARRDHDRFRRVGGVHRPVAAVIVARPSDADGVPDTPADILLVSPRSVNGCWIQLDQLVAGDGLIARGELSFAAGGGDPERVIMEVILGHAGAGAVPRSAVESLVSRGVIERREIAIVAAYPGLPEYLLLAKPGTPLPDEIDGVSAVSIEDQERIDRLRSRAGAVVPTP